jgi:phage baseplate assembly protein W
MAYRPISINPLDLKASTAIGVSIPFSSQGVFNSVYTTSQQLKNNIINYLLTDKRERLYDPSFGAGLRSYLFEQMTDLGLEGLEEAIKVDIQRYFPKALVSGINITPNYDQNYFTLSISYSIQNTGIQDQILLNFQNGN